MAFDAERFTDALMLGTKMLIAKAVEPLAAENADLRARNAALETRLEAVEARDVAAELLPSIENVARAVAALPAAPDLSGFAMKADIPPAPDLTGFATKDDLAEVAAAIPEIPEVDLSGFAVKSELAALRQEIPPAPDLTGFATKAEIEALRGDIPTSPDLSGLATKADLDALEPARHGRDADMTEVARLIGEAVSKAVSALPPAKDGAPGADADMAVILRHVEETVAAVVPPRDELIGPEGRMPLAKAWSDGVHYAGAVVTHRGALYQASADTGREPPHGDWTCLAARGDDGRSIDVRGTYEDGAEYRHLDIVAMNGGSFIALRDSPGECPGDGWQLLAGRGKPGQSVKGDRGPKGEPGDDAPTIVAAAVSPNGVLTITCADGTEATADFYPVISRMMR